MAKAKKLKSGKWRTLVYDYTDTSGKRCYESFTADTKKESEYLAAEFSLNKKNKDPLTCITFKNAFSKYIEDRSSVLSPATIREYKRKSNYNFKKIDNILLSDMTQNTIQDFINQEAKHLSPKTIHDLHGIIFSILKDNQIPICLNTTLPKKVRTNLYVPSDEDIKAIMKYAKDTPMELPILLAAFGPLRRGEICALDSNHVSGNTVHVEFTIVQNASKEWVKKAPKSYAGDRYIDFPEFVSKLWQNKTGLLADIEHPGIITKRFEHILKNANVPHFRFHDLRHYSASIQHALGVPDAYIMKRGGWSTDNTLKSIYRHSMDQEELKNNRKANEHFSKMQHEMQHEI